MMVSLVLLLAFALPFGSVRQEAPLPALALRDLRGRTVTLERYRGKVVLLNFWATWCPPCRAETPDLVALQARYGASGLQVVGVTCPPYSRAEVTKFTKQAGVNYPILLGTKDIARRISGTEVLPVTLLLDRTGKIAARIDGILTPEEVDEKVLPLLASGGSSGTTKGPGLRAPESSFPISGAPGGLPPDSTFRTLDIEAAIRVSCCSFQGCERLPCAPGARQGALLEPTQRTGSERERSRTASTHEKTVRRWWPRGARATRGHQSACLGRESASSS
jgi:thiol-disulfide isomerase/thioredoxin